MKVRVALVLALTSLFVAPAVASAQRPDTSPPPGDYEIQVPAGEAPCAVTIQFHDNSRARVFTDTAGDLRFIHVTGRLTAEVTSDDTGNSISVTIPGPVFISNNGNMVLAGAMLLFGPNILALVNGRAVVPAGNINDVVITGKQVDLCPILNP